MFKKLQTSKGATAILLTVLILSGILIIGLAVASLMMAEIKMAGQVGQSVPAYYAADAGAERGLYEVLNKTGPIYNNGQGQNLVSVTLDNGASYEVIWDGGAKLTSLGKYQQTRRKIEIVVF